MTLTDAIIQAAKEFQEEDFGPQFYDEDEAQIPRAFYVQKYTDGTWSAAFRPVDDMDEIMTRFDDGQEAEDFFALVISDGEEAVSDAADDIVAIWDEEWNEEA